MHNRLKYKYINVYVNIYINHKNIYHKKTNFTFTFILRLGPCFYAMGHNLNNFEIMVLHNNQSQYHVLIKTKCVSLLHSRWSSVNFFLQMIFIYEENVVCNTFPMVILLEHVML